MMGALTDTRGESVMIRALLDLAAALSGSVVRVPHLAKSTATGIDGIPLVKVVPRMAAVDVRGLDPSYVHWMEKVLLFCWVRGIWLEFTRTMFGGAETAGAAVVPGRNGPPTFA